MPDVRWFAGSTVNYARAALRWARSDPDATAVIFRSEAGHRATLSYRELVAEVARVQAGLREIGVTRGDRVAAFVPNIPAALVAMLAVTGLGAIWSSCSPDFGAASVVDRFAQIEPRVLIAVDGYRYGGKDYPRGDAVAEIASALPGLRAIVGVDYLGVGLGQLGTRTIVKMSEGCGSSTAASCCAARKIRLSLPSACSSARVDEGRPMTNGIIMWGKTTTSRSGTMGSVS